MNQKEEKRKCRACGDLGRVHSRTLDGPTVTSQCGACCAPDVADTIAFRDDGANLHSTGYGTPIYSIGYEHDSVNLNPAEARAVAAALLAWADRVAPVPV